MGAGTVALGGVSSLGGAGFLIAAPVAMDALGINAAIQDTGASFLNHFFDLRIPTRDQRLHLARDGHASATDADNGNPVRTTAKFAIGGVASGDRDYGVPHAPTLVAAQADADGQGADIASAGSGASAPECRTNSPAGLKRLDADLRDPSQRSQRLASLEAELRSTLANGPAMVCFRGESGGRTLMIGKHGSKVSVISMSNNKQGEPVGAPKFKQFMLDGPIGKASDPQGAAACIVSGITSEVMTQVVSYVREEASEVR